jgi:hypothetical protein
MGEPERKNRTETARAVKFSKGDGTQQERAARFGVSMEVVANIDAGYTWIWLGETREQDNKRMSLEKKEAKRKREEEEEEQQPTTISADSRE